MIFLLFCIPLLSLGQSSSVTVTVKGKYDHLNRNSWATAWIYNSDTSYKQYSQIYKRKAHFDSLPDDNYTVTIYSKYGTKDHNTLTIETNSKKTYKLKSRPKPFIRYKDTIPLLCRLKSDDTLNINWSINGCFNFDNNWYDIYKLDTNYYVRFTHQDSILEKKLNSEITDKIIQAEHHKFRGGPPITPSTNRDYYIFHFNNEVYRFRNDALSLAYSIYKEHNTN